MKTLSYKPLPIKHISEGIRLTKKTIRERAEGKLKPLRTSKAKFDKVLMNGVDWGRILTFAGLSGSGKSTILENLRTDFVALNTDQEFDILAFEFEMLIEDQLTRMVSSKIDRSLKDIYSVNGALTEKEIQEVEKVLDERKDSNVYYVDESGTVDDVISTITKFADEHSTKERGLVVTIDHILLTKGKQGDAEKAVIDNLMAELVALKKKFASKEIRCIFVLLTQLNRDIQTIERAMNPLLHYPTRNDIFAASSVYHGSDYVFITHKPALITGIGKWYGPEVAGHKEGLPVRCPSKPSNYMIYWHVVKERFGEDKSIIPLVEDFKHSRLEEYTL